MDITRTDKNTMPEQVQENMHNIKTVNDKIDARPVGLIDKGTWTRGRHYYPQQVVYYNDASYVCTRSIVSLQTPDIDTTHFSPFAKGIKGDKGDKGDTGNGIASITKTGTVGLVDTYTITFTNGTTMTFAVTNGQDGATGNGIASITKTGSVGLVDTYTITFTDGTTTTFDITNGQDGATGNGIASITKTGSVGLVDTYTITFTNGTTTTFNVTNGAKGDTGNGIASITKTGTVGLVDTYTITFTDGTTTTFDITNGYTPNIEIIGGVWYIDGVSTGIRAVGQDGRGITTIAKTITSGLVDTYTITFTDNTTTTYTVTNGATGQTGATGNGIASITKTGTSGLVDTYTITFTDGTTTTYTVTNGAKGDTGNGIASITKTGTSGNVDTYTITFTDGTTYSYNVTNADITNYVTITTNQTISGTKTFSSRPNFNDALNTKNGLVYANYNNLNFAVLGFTQADGKINCGNILYPLNLLGSTTRPQYNGNDMALYSDIPTALSQLTQSASYRTVTDTEKSTWNGKNNATSYNLVSDSGQAATSGYVRKRIANINGQYLTFHKQFSSSASNYFSGGSFTNILLAWVEQASTSDTQSQRTTLQACDNDSWRINGNYRHWICVIGLTN